MNPQPFTDHCAVTRGLQIAEQRAPLFAAHLQSVRENMERVAEQTARLDFPATAAAMKHFAEGFRHE